MSLKITLKPNERMIIDGAVITNGSTKAQFTIDNNVTILRQKNIMGEKDASSPARRIYFVVQLMYVDQKNITAHHRLYWTLIKDFIQAAPRAVEIIDRMSEYIFHEKYYEALKTAKELIDYEQEVIESCTIKQ